MQFVLRTKDIRRVRLTSSTTQTCVLKIIKKWSIKTVPCCYACVIDNHIFFTTYSAVRRLTRIPQLERILTPPQPPRMFFTLISSRNPHHRCRYGRWVWRNGGREGGGREGEGRGKGGRGKGLNGNIPKETMRLPWT